MASHSRYSHSLNRYEFLQKLNYVGYHWYENIADGIIQYVTDQFGCEVIDESVAYYDYGRILLRYETAKQWNPKWIDNIDGIRKNNNAGFALLVIPTNRCFLNHFFNHNTIVCKPEGVV